MKAINKKDFDISVRPQDDFYRHVNGSWLKKTEIPETENRWGSFSILHRSNMKILRSILNNVVKEKSGIKGDAKKMADLYLTAIDIKKRNKQGLRYLRKGFEVIESIKEREDLSRVLGYLHVLGVDAPWRLWIDQDDKKSERMVLRIGQGGIGVPDRNYLVKNDKESKRIKDAYRKYINGMLLLEGHYNASEIPKIINTIVQIETRFAGASMTPVERRNVHAMYNKHSVGKLQKAYPATLWKKYFDFLKIPQKARQHIIVDQPKFLKEVNTLLEKAPLSDLRVYLRWHYLDAYAGTLGDNFVKTRFAYYGQAILGTKKIPELWKRGVGIVNALMGDALGRLYVQEYFPPNSKKKITKLVRNITGAYRKRLTELDWMSKSTKKKALRKLDRISLQLGYPDKWKSYGKLDITRESFTRNLMEGARFDFEIEVRKLAKKTDRNEWAMSAPTVNAYYSPNLNQIAFPAGILQPPFFYPEADDAVNYGAIGSVIGHELTHGFDDEGSLFDEYGDLRDWWTKKDRERFDKRTKVLERQFNLYKVVDGITVNGKLTLGENIADLGGIIIAYEALCIALNAKLQKNIDGFTPHERFFISHAISEKALYRDEFLKLITLNDPHSPSEFRSNGPVSNFDAFYEVFNVKKGDALYRKEADRVRIW